MKRLLLAALVLPTTIFISCNNKTEEEEPVNEAVTSAPTPVTYDTTNKTALPEGGAATATAAQQPQQVQQPVQTVATMPATALPSASQSQSQGNQKLNPAHGQPGHRCDIAVGAPLNSPASTPVPKTVTGTATATGTPATTNPAVTVTPQQIMPSTSPAPSTGNAKLNPAHGQPGHDCTIPVGAPLKNQ